jgi:SAM-dependent methyltransferase
MLRLNLGCGQMYMSGYVNVDSSPTFAPRADVRFDIMELAHHYEENSVDEILIIHILEHFYVSEAADLLSQCLHVLKPGGRVVIEHACILGAFRQYADDHHELIRCLYGRETRRLEHGDRLMHKWGWTGPILADFLQSLGYTIDKVREGRKHRFPDRDLHVTAIKPTGEPQCKTTHIFLED